jgi:RNA polymerase sigma factor (sigma-70 family)
MSLLMRSVSLVELVGAREDADKRPLIQLSTISPMEQKVSGALVVAAAEGNDEAWGLLVDRFAGLIWAIARSHGLSTSDAADVSQSTWLRFAEHAQRIRQPERVAGWLATTARNESVRLLRRGRRDVPMAALSEDRLCDDATELDTRLLEEERDKSLVRAFDALPSRCKTLLRVLTAVPAPSYAEASVVLEMPVGSIGPTRARCLDHLRRCASVTPTGRQAAGEGGAAR